MSSSFAQLGVPESICRALSERGFNEPFEIQAATIADAMAGRDVCGRAPTGSGKTLAFGIPLIAEVGRAEPRRPRALILAPTRELAEQINAELRSFAGKVRIGVVYGGVGYEPQLRALRQGVDILVACPGRLEDLLDQGALELSAVDRVVLDEADRMADMGFMPAVRRLLDQTSRSRQTVLFSATLDGDVAKLTRDYQNDPVRHEVGEETPDIESASHVFWKVARADRAKTTANAINAVWPAIVFCRTRHGSDRLAKQLSRAGIDAAAIHGGRSQRQRTRALSDFANGRVHALVATDVAARGIHVDGVAVVIHYDPPEDQKAYVHRSGRTARAGEGGVVLSLVQPDQKKDLGKLQRRIGLDEPFIEPDAAALRDLSPTPARTLPPAGPREDRSDDERRSRPPRRKHHGGPKRSGQGKAGQSRNGQRSGSGKGGQTKGKAGSQHRKGRSTAAAHKGRPKSKSGKNGNNGAQGSKSGGPNRKARRAHLQPGAGANQQGQRAKQGR